MSSVRGINNNNNHACPIHQGFLQALLAFQSACHMPYRPPYKTPTTTISAIGATKYRQQTTIGTCTCVLHRILIQVIRSPPPPTIHTTEMNNFH